MKVAMGTRTLLPWAEESTGETCRPNQIKNTEEVSPGVETGSLLQHSACPCPVVIPAPPVPAVKLNSNLLQTGCLKVLWIPKALGVMSDKQPPILGNRLLLSCAVQWHMASIVKVSWVSQTKAETTHSVPRWLPCFANALVAMTQILVGICHT